MIPCERNGAPRAIYAILIPIYNRIYTHFTCHFLFAVFGDNGGGDDNDGTGGSLDSRVLGAGAAISRS